MTAAAGLLDIFSFRLGLAHDRFLIRDLGAADVRFHAEFALHAVDQHFEMQLSHAGDDGLTRIGIARHTERRIFFGKAMERRAHLFLVGLRLRLDTNADNGLGEGDLFQDDRFIRIAKRIAGRRILKAHDRRDLAGIDLFHFFAIVRMHTDNTADALLIVFAGIQNI